MPSGCFFAFPFGPLSRTLNHSITTDSYTPDPDPTYEAPQDVDLDGAPPQLYPWEEIRTTGSAGIVEEVPSTFAGVTAAVGDNFGAVYFEGGSGPVGRPARQQAPLPGAWSFQTYLYADPTQEPAEGVGGGPNGDGTNIFDDFWWTSAVQDTRGAPFDNYLTESGFVGEIVDDGLDPRVWRLTPAEFIPNSGFPSFDAAVGQWYTLEVLFHDNGIDGGVAATHNIWNHPRTQLLYTFTLDHTFQNEASAWLGGPLYTWFLPGGLDDNVHRLLIDEVGVGPAITAVPEPGSSALIGLGVLGLPVFALRRRKLCPKLSNSTQPEGSSAVRPR